MGVPTTVVVAPLRRPGTGALRFSRAFSLIEVLVAVTLMSVIVLGLLTMFSQTQKAFRTGITQVDVMESGRAAIEMMTRELEQMRPTGLPNSVSFNTGWVSLPTPPATPPFCLIQTLPGSNQKRTNILEYIGFTVRENQTWTWIGYTLSVSNNLGTLSRYETNVAALDLSQAVSTPPGINPFLNTASQARIADGVVSLRVLAYNDKGNLITSFDYPTGTGKSVQAADIKIGGQFTDNYEYTFYSNAVPAYLDLELGILEAKTADRARPLPFAAQSAYLDKQVGHVQIFRQRIPIRNVDTSVYQ